MDEHVYVHVHTVKKKNFFSHVVLVGLVIHNVITMVMNSDYTADQN